MSTEELKPFRRLVTIAEQDMHLDEATGRASFIFNTEDVGRDLHVVRNKGIHDDNFRANPVILFAHDDESPPVGRAVDITIADPASRVTVEFTPRDLYPFGDMIGRMVKARYLNCVSESWQPLKAKLRAGGEGYDFLEVDLLEISIVPVPALPQAIATARAAGIDITPLIAWAEKILDTGGLTTVKRAELETLRRAAQMPVRRRSSAGKPAKETSVTLKEKLARALKRAPKVPNFRRGLYDVAQLAYLLASLGYCQESSEFEEALEEDDSKVPAMLGEALQALGAAMIAMTEEEVGELLARIDEPEGAERGLRAKSRKWIREATTAARRTWRAAIALCRDAESLPADSVDKLTEAHEQHKRAAKHLRATGEHQEAAADHIDDARDAHSDLTVQHRHVGEAIDAADTALAANEPKEAAGHLKRAADHYSQAEGHIAEVAAAHKDAADRCEDAGDSHRGCTRALGKATDCVRSVVEHLQATDPDDDVEGVEDEEKARAALVARRTRRKAATSSAASAGATPAAGAAATTTIINPSVAGDRASRERLAIAMQLSTPPADAAA